MIEPKVETQESTTVREKHSGYNEKGLRSGTTLLVIDNSLRIFQENIKIYARKGPVAEFLLRNVLIPEN